MKNLKSKDTNSVFVLVLLLQLTLPIFCQESETIQTLFNKDTKIGYQWSPGIKFNSIQGDIGSLIELYGGPSFNRSYFLGLAGGVNFGHPRVNYGYFGMIMQYTVKPQKLLHFGGQGILAYGSTKDYEKEKSSLFDNFWNISGTGFYLIEPGLNLDLNLKENMKLSAGVSFRMVTGLNENSEYVSITHVTGKEMSGFNFRMGLIFGKT